RLSQPLSVTTLISDTRVTGQLPWTAAQLANLVLNNRRDFSVLSGHCTQNDCLAADYQTRFTSYDVISGTADLTNALFAILGCHSGFPMPDAEAAGPPQPYRGSDLPQAFNRRGASLVAMYGYAYGDINAVA